VSRLGKLLGGSASRWFISTRGLSSVLALLLALSYTKLLGLEKRSVLAFIMVSALILTILLTSGLSLALRNKPRSAIKDEEFIGYIVLILGASILVGLINCILLSVYSNLKAEIPLPIFIVCFVYSFLACFTLGLQDALLAAGNLKIATIFDLLTILTQILTLLFLVNISQTSLMVSVFISFIFSYSLISFGSLTIFLFNTPVEKSRLTHGLKSILTESKAHQFFAIANGLVDRIDRFIIGLILPIAYLAKYALLSSIISFARFLPDSAIKLYLFKHHRREERIRMDYTIRTVGFIAICGVLFVVLSQGFILIAFGSDWLLPTTVGALLVVQEILRGNYQLSAMRLIAAGKTLEMSRISGVLIFTSISLIVLAVHSMGVWGAPLAMVVTYLITTILVEKKLKEITNDN
jgi:O-antigen/teichoic acid export membrane protein